MAALEGMISGPLAEVLAARRAWFNARFASVRALSPCLDGDAFSHHLAVNVAPIVEAVAAVAPDQVAEVSAQLYEVSLDLVARDVLGPLAKLPAFNELWRDLLAHCPRQLAAAPERMLASMTNALHHLLATGGTRPGEWVSAMKEFARTSGEPDTLLQLGHVAAWRAGLAHLRRSALDLCPRLPSEPLALALGLPVDAITDPIGVVTRLRDDPWLTPAEAAANPPNLRPLRIVARLGAFRGFGGLFLTPPTVRTEGDEILASDVESTWLLTADVFGATWHRIVVTPAAGASAASSVKGAGAPIALVNVDAIGNVQFDRNRVRFEELRDRTSFAATAHVLAVTVPFSHAVILVARKT